MNISEIKKYRRHLGLTQQDFSILCGLGKVTIPRLESGKQKPNRATLTLLRLAREPQNLRILFDMHRQMMSHRGQLNMSAYFLTQKKNKPVSGGGYNE